MKLLHQKDNRKINNRNKFLQQDKHRNCSTKFQYTLCIATSMRSDLCNWYRNPLPTSFFQRFDPARPFPAFRTRIIPLTECWMGWEMLICNDSFVECCIGDVAVGLARVYSVFILKIVWRAWESVHEDV